HSSFALIQRSAGKRRRRVSSCWPPLSFSSLRSKPKWAGVAFAARICTRFSSITNWPMACITPISFAGMEPSPVSAWAKRSAGHGASQTMNFAGLRPDPLAAQLAMYLGYVHYRVVGATVAGVAFVLPSLLMVVAIRWAYVRYGGLPWMPAAFYGVGAAVIGIIAISAYKLTTKNVGNDKLLWAIYLITAGITVWTQSERVWLFLGAGVLVGLVRAPPRRGFGKSVAPGLIALGPH